MLIDKSHFFDTLSIDHNKTGASEQLFRYISQYEHSYGTGLFGFENWIKITNNINSEPYETLKGLLTLPLSPIACYVFNYFQQDQIAKATGIGDVRSAAENSTLTSQTYRMRIAWNAMVDRNRQILGYMKANKNTVFSDLNFRAIGCNRAFFTKHNDWGI